MGLWLKVCVAMTLVLCAALGLSVFLNYAKFDAAYIDMSRSRLLVLSQDVSNAVESGMALGLGIGELRNLQQIAERVKAEAAEIRSVAVVDSRGAVVASSERVIEPPTLPAGQVAAILDDANAPWSAVEGAGALIGLPIMNSFQVPAGVVVVRDDAILESRIIDRPALAGHLLVSVAGVVVIGVLLLRLGIGRAASLVVVATLICAGLLGYARFRTAHAELTLSRVQVLAHDVRSAVESGLALGLGIGELRNSQETVARLQADGDEVKSIIVADTNGVVRFDSRGQVGGVVGIEAMLSEMRVRGVWTAGSGADAQLGLPIYNTFRVPVGAVLLRYDARSQTAVGAEVLGKMVKATLVIVAVASVVMIQLVVLSFAPLRRTFRAMLAVAEATLPPETVSAHALGEAVKETVSVMPVERPSAMPVERPSVVGGSLEAEFGVFAQSVTRTLKQMKGAIHA
jgi:hypothetical protein